MAAVTVCSDFGAPNHLSCSQLRDQTQVSCIEDSLPSEPPGKPSHQLLANKLVAVVKTKKNNLCLKKLNAAAENIEDI